MDGFIKYKKGDKMYGKMKRKGHCKKEREGKEGNDIAEDIVERILGDDD